VETTFPQQPYLQSHLIHQNPLTKSNPRAFGRSEIIGHVIKEGWADFLEQTAAHHDPRRPPYVINWSVLQLQGSPAFVMADPFRTYVQESRDYCTEGSSRTIPEQLSTKQDT